jgi:hypothetical protein
VRGIARWNCGSYLSSLPADAHSACGRAPILPAGNTLGDGMHGQPAGEERERALLGDRPDPSEREQCANDAWLAWVCWVGWVSPSAR